MKIAATVRTPLGRALVVRDAVRDEVEISCGGDVTRGTWSRGLVLTQAVKDALDPSGAELPRILRELEDQLTREPAPAAQAVERFASAVSARAAEAALALDDEPTTTDAYEPPAAQADERGDRRCVVCAGLIAGPDAECERCAPRSPGSTLTHEQARRALDLAVIDLAEAGRWLSRAAVSLDRENWPHLAGLLQDAAYAAGRAQAHTYTAIGFTERREALSARAADRTRLGVVGGAA